jgi:magnesium transporter
MREPLDQYGDVTRISQSQVEVLMGVTEFHRACAGTTNTIAAERMGLIAAVTLAVTAVSSAVGTNTSTHWVVLLVLLALMLARSGVVLRWSKRLGLW